MQGFWEYLWDDIRSKLSYKHIVRSRWDELHKIKHMKTLPGWFIYDGEPLVPDTDQDVYLSDEYESEDIRILKDLGMKQISSTQILERIKVGLSTSTDTPIHDIPLDDPWHTAFAALIERLLETDIVKKDVKKLKIIPLDDGSWVSHLSLHVHAVYLPYLVDEDSVSIKIPDGLGFQKLHQTAAADGERASLYTSLGITSCHPDTVTAKILEMHKSGSRTGNALQFQMDLEILFWFGMQPSSSTQDHMSLVSDQNHSHRGRFLFFPSEDDYHSEKLLAATPKEDWDHGKFGILDKRYLESQVRDRHRYGLDWESYLQGWGVKYFPDLTTGIFPNMKIHPLIKLIARDNPDSFVANLKAHWSDYRIFSYAIKKDLKDVRVPCLNDSTQRLCDTILPTHELMDRSRDPNLTNLLPFLKLPRDYDTQKSEAWFFLKDFGVICEVNASFYLRALYLLADLGEDHLLQTCEKIYSGIAQTTAVGNAKVVEVCSFHSCRDLY